MSLNNQPAVKGVYSIDGRYLGNDVSKLGKGLYIVNGKIGRASCRERV